MSLKTKLTWRIFQPIEELVKRLSDLLSANPENSSETLALRKLILDQLYTFSEKLDNASKEDDNDYQETKKKITSIIEEFCTMDFDKKVDDVRSQIGREIFTGMLSKFSQLLENLEKSEVLPLKQGVQECLDYVKDMGNSPEIEDLQNIKELGISIADILGPLQYYQKNLLSKLLSEKLALYCSQLYSSYSMLVEVIKEQHQLSASIYTCKKYICDRLSLCLESIIDHLDAPNPSEEEEFFEQENNFVYKVDLVLDIIGKLSSKSQKDQVKDCEDIWLGIEDVFAHAMSIAQVCQPYNFKAISGSCQSVLLEYDNLKTQLLAEPPDKTMNDLFINTLTDSLYRLERKINISVLTLVMEVFSDPFSILKKLIKICGTSLNANDRSKSDLNSAIEEFDQLTDKTVQIGKFAIACSKDKNRAAKIRNCLASFESLEMELVPAIASFYLHPNNKELRSCVKLLTAQWQLELNKFQHTVDLIIDPAAYCQIVLDDLQEKTNEMSNCLDSRQDITQQQVQIIVQRALSLSRQISATIEDLGQENIDKQTTMTIREFKAAIYETDAASKKFLINKATAPEQLRVINRCEIMLKVVKRLQPVLSFIVNNSITMNTIYNNKSLKGQGDAAYTGRHLSFPSSIHGLPFDEKSSAYIRTPYTVKNCKHTLSIQPANAAPRNESDIPALIPYIQKGRIIRTEWSVMYKTPNSCNSAKPVQNGLRMKNLECIRQHLFSRDSFLEETETDFVSETLDLTNILENITKLSDTLSSNVCTDISTLGRQQNKSLMLLKAKNNKVQLNLVTKLFRECSTSGGGDAPFPLPSLIRTRSSKKKGNRVGFSINL